MPPIVKIYEWGPYHGTYHMMHVMFPTPPLWKHYLPATTVGGSNNKFSNQTQGLAPPAVWEILDPPLHIK